jgi:chaperonin GroEL
MAKIITKFNPDIIRSAVNKIAEPIIQTLTPMGNNVMFEKDLHTLITNDGVTIAKMIDSPDPTEDAIIQMVKYGSLSTNQVAGDGTSTTILFTKRLVDMGLDRIAEGVPPMVLKKELTEMGNSIVEEAEKLKNKVTKKDIAKIASISSGGDNEVADKVVEVIETAGTDGMVFINESKNNKTKVIKDSGYNLDSPMFDPVLGNISPGRADYKQPFVFITDKKLYHIEECKEILEAAHKAQATEVVIVARDFLGESPNFLISNHLNADVPLSVLLIKYTTPENNTTPLYDLATYLGGKVVSEKIGSFKGKLNNSHFIQAERVYSFMDKTILVTNDKTNPELSLLIEEVRAKKELEPENNEFARRLASLTAGTVTLEVGATTGPELRELIYRYEDAINASRAALKSGYVVGGGLTLYNVTREMNDFAREFGLTSIKQIAENTGQEFVEEMYGGTMGFNAKTRRFSTLESDGVIEPFDVFKYSVSNAVSIAVAILTSGYFIVKDNENKNDQ